MTSIPPFLAKIDNLQQQIADYGDWDEVVRKRIAYKFRLDWNYHSQSIEGGTLTRRETRTIMVGQVDVHGKPLKDVLEMTQHNEVVQEIMAVGKGQKRLSESRIKQIHAAIMYEEDPEKRKLLGNWKTQPNEIFNHKGEKFEFASPEDVSDEIHDLLNRTNANWDKLDANKKNATHPVLMALDFHLEFLTIHPFYDCNGRTARILLNLILISFGYPAIIVKNEDKEVYGRYIAEIQGYGANRELDYEFMAGLLIRSQELVLQALDGEDIDEPDDLFKEIELFQKEQEAKVKGLETRKFDDTVFVDLIDKILIPIYEGFLRRALVFDSSFVTVEITLEADFETRNQKGGRKTYSSTIIPLQSKNLELATQHLKRESKNFTLKVNWKGYKYNLSNPFDIHFKLEPYFFDYELDLHWMIGQQGHRILTSSYARLLKEGVNHNELIKLCIEATFKCIKSESSQ